MGLNREPGAVTALLRAWGQGDVEAHERLVPLVYVELRRIAARYLRRERADHTLQPTALVHEAYLRLVEQSSVRWQNRAQFFGLAAQAMRRILVDHARSHHAIKRGGAAIRVPLAEEVVGYAVSSVGAAAGATREVSLIDLDSALVELGALDPQLVRVVELRYFGGLTIEETAVALGISATTVKRDWATAKAWLFARLHGQG